MQKVYKGTRETAFVRKMFYCMEEKQRRKTKIAEYLENKGLEARKMRIKATDSQWETRIDDYELGYTLQDCTDVQFSIEYKAKDSEVLKNDLCKEKKGYAAIRKKSKTYKEIYRMFKENQLRVDIHMPNPVVLIPELMLTAFEMTEIINKKEGAYYLKISSSCITEETKIEGFIEIPLEDYPETEV